eukprot:COSAG03_NODE_613_length_6714_cov_4.286168_2_plen_211_part_00
MAAALNPQLTATLAALDVVQPGLGNEFVAHVGTTMALAAAMPPDWFPKTGTPTVAQIATFVMKLHGLTTIVWANYPTAGVTGMSNWIMPHGSELTEAIRTELLQTGVAPGSGTVHADVHDLGVGTFDKVRALQIACPGLATGVHVNDEVGSATIARFPINTSPGGLIQFDPINPIKSSRDLSGTSLSTFRVELLDQGAAHSTDDAAVLTA